MSDALAASVQFVFIVLVPLVVVGGALASLFAVGALFDALENPGDLRGRVEGLFRRPVRPPKPLGADHYYQAYWKPSEPGKAAGA
jgi:hypothetical protein